LDQEGEKMRKAGNEFGSTTGRPRRCGWIDLPALKYSIMINGVTQLLMMKADVLDTFSIIKVCTKYKLANGQVSDTLPYELINEKLSPVYTEMKGWDTPLRSVTKNNMPAELNAYVSFLQKELEVPIILISTGPDRLHTIHL
jgi:adenylosuccinate synthase